MSAELTDLLFVGPKTALVLEAVGIQPEDVRKRRVSHAELVEAGVNPGVAAKIRREHSLSWSLEGGEDLDRRAEQVRGLQDGEREWVAASAADWEGSETRPDNKEPAKESTDWIRRPWPNKPDADSDFEAEAEWRDRSKPTPLTKLTDLNTDQRDRLREAGINTVRQLATCDPSEVARSIEIEERDVRKWRAAARNADR